MSYNVAAEWPNWAGEVAIVLATGPSAAQQPLHLARGRAKIIAIKESWKLIPRADIVYGCDQAWWVSNQGCPQFCGLKVSASPSACKVFGLKQVRLVPRASVLIGEIGRIGCGIRTGGGHSGFHALNLAVQFGAKRIVLVGFDMRLDQGMHWHGQVHGVAKRKDAKAMAEHREALDACKEEFDRLGVELLNASPISALEAYPKMSLVDALA